MEETMKKAYAKPYLSIQRFAPNESVASCVTINMGDLAGQNIYRIKGSDIVVATGGEGFWDNGDGVFSEADYATPLGSGLQTSPPSPGGNIMASDGYVYMAGKGGWAWIKNNTSGGNYNKYWIVGPAYEWNYNNNAGEFTLINNLLSYAVFATDSSDKVESVNAS